MTASASLLGLAALAAVYLGVHHAILTTRALEHERAPSLARAPARAPHSPRVLATAASSAGMLAASLEPPRDLLAQDRGGAA